MGNKRPRNYHFWLFYNDERQKMKKPDSQLEFGIVMILMVKVNAWSQQNSTVKWLQSKWAKHTWQRKIPMQNAISYVKVNTVSLSGIPLHYFYGADGYLM